jgi:rhodanese-related sulfurtransferase
VIFHCQSGMRTAGNARRLAGACAGEAYVLAGGLNAWRAAGLPVA